MYIFKPRGLMTKQYFLFLLIVVILGFWLVPSTCASYKKNDIHNITVRQTAVIDAGSLDVIQHILKKLQVQYNVLSKSEFKNHDSSYYQVVILPDNAHVDDDLSDSVASYIENGGAFIACGSWPSRLDDLQYATSHRKDSSFLELATSIKKSRVQTLSKAFSSLSNMLVSKVHKLSLARAAIRMKLNTGLSTSTLLNQSLGAMDPGHGDAKDCAHDFGKGVMYFLHTATAENSNHEFSDEAMDEFERFIRTHTDEFIIVRDRDHPYHRFEGVEVMLDRPQYGDEMHLYLTPMHSFEDIKLRIFFRPPTGKLITHISFSENSPVHMLSTYTAFSVFDSLPTDKWQTGKYTIYLGNEHEDSTHSDGPNWPNHEFSEVAERLFSFMKEHMRDKTKDGAAKYGIYTAYKDAETTSDDPYAEGHHVTAEHMGLFIRTAVCLQDKKAFDQGVQYIKKIMQSPLTKLVNWAVNKHTDEPYIADGGENADAPLDDMRVIRGLLRGGHFLHNDSARRIGETALTALYWYGITSRGRIPDRTEVHDYYGVSGYAYNWSETKSCPNRSRIAMDTHLLPVNYNDLYVFEKGARMNPRWIPILESALQFILDSDIHGNGLFMNSYYPGRSGKDKWSGDFEYQGTGEHGRASHMKCIQSLWSAIHLANTYRNDTPLLSGHMKDKARDGAMRAFRKWKDIYERYDGRVPEYLDFNGDKPGENAIEGSYCSEGEPRISALIARLSFLVGETQFAHRVVKEKLLDHWSKQHEFPFVWNDVESFNVLETTLAICEVSGGKS